VRSIRTRLTLVFAAIVAGALGLLYLWIVPPLQSRLIDGKLAALASAADRYGGPLGRTVGSDLSQGEVVRRVRAAAASSAARVALVRVGRAGSALQTSVIADSNGAERPSDLQFSPALEAAASGRPATGVESTGSGRWGEAARPFARSGRVAAVAIFASPLAEVQRTVAVVRRRVLAGGVIALLAAALVGALVARALARRIGRLERAAELAAAGDFSARIPIDSDDELGQLARAFNTMQGQVARLERARRQFIATASHELRTPIFSLGGFVELLEDEELDEDTRRRFVAQLRDQVERLRKLSVDLLDLSRLEAGSLELRPEAIDVAALARSVAGEFEPALARHDSNLELRVGRERTEAFCDPVRVAQVLRILIDNALTHTSPGTDIVVTAARGNGRVRVAVRDGGAGIRRADIDRIFEPFFTSDDAQGSGLGLAIASELAERMAGRLAVDSRPGGTTFTLEIPAS
jgi:two-component system OmpR family sensor kinase